MQAQGAAGSRGRWVVRQRRGGRGVRGGYDHHRFDDGRAEVLRAYSEWSNATFHHLRFYHLERK